MAFLGPDSPGLGERKEVPEVTQSQIAATLAALLGILAPVVRPSRCVHSLDGETRVHEQLLACEVTLNRPHRDLPHQPTFQ